MNTENNKITTAGFLTCYTVEVIYDGSIQVVGFTPRNSFGPICYGLVVRDTQQIYKFTDSVVEALNELSRTHRVSTRKKIPQVEDNKSFSIPNVLSDGTVLSKLLSENKGHEAVNKLLRNGIADFIAGLITSNQLDMLSRVTEIGYYKSGEVKEVG